MKGFDKKGVSPVIATILLIALTVAAVGMVAVVLSTVSPTGAGINAMLVTDRVENNATNNEMKVVLKNWGPDAIQAGSISIEVEGGWYGAGAPADHYARGSAEKLPDAGAGDYVDISWVTANPPDLEVAQWPWKAGSGSTLVIIFKGTDAENFKPTSLTIKDASTGTVIFQDTSLPDPIPV